MSSPRDYSWWKSMEGVAVDSCLKSRRNIGIIAHIDAGKTTVTERILFFSGKIHRIGEVHEGEATMDFMDQEQERGITIQSANTEVVWIPVIESPWKSQEMTICIIDTPGHVDFTAEVERSLRVLDGAVTVLDGVAGVEPQSETVWRQANKYGVPRIIFVNKMDRTGANFDFCVSSVKKKLAVKKAFPIMLPIGSGSSFVGIVDLINMVGYQYDDADCTSWKCVDIPDEMQDEAYVARLNMLDHLVDFHESPDRMLSMLLDDDDKSIPTEEIFYALRKAVCTNMAYPILCGSAFKNKGMHMLLDMICGLLPSPMDMPSSKGIMIQDGEEQSINIPYSYTLPLIALVFKIMTDTFTGRVLFVKIYSGILKRSSTIINSRTQKSYRVSKILKFHASSKSEVQEAYAGDIVGVVGVEQTKTGDTFTDEQVKGRVMLESITFPNTVVSMSIEPHSKSDREKLAVALSALSDEDPTFLVSTNQETGETIISGMGELHLDVLRTRMERDFKVRVILGRPRVSYRETITQPSKTDTKFVKQTGGRGQYAHVCLELAPLEKGAGVVIESKIVGGVIPKEYIPAVKKGIEEGLSNGIIAGYPVLDVLVRIVFGSYHEVDSNEMAFKICGALSVQEGLKKSAPILLEPIMKLEVVSPSDTLGDVLGDVSKRRGRVNSQEVCDDMASVAATVPLSELFGYQNHLRSLTAGRGSGSMEYSHFEQVPAKIQNLLSQPGN